MCRVSSLKSLSLRVVADFVWDVLKTKSTPVEQTQIKRTKFMNFTMKRRNLETTLNQLNEYLSLPTSLKLELSRVLSRQYESCNLLQMLLMIEMGFHCLDVQHYFHLSGNLTFLNLLTFGKKSMKKLILSKWRDNRVTSISTQEFIITTFPYLQELNATGNCCNDDTLCLVAKNCQHLKILNVNCAHGVTDQGIKFLCSPQSAAKQLVDLSFFGTKVTAEGAETALTHLARLESLYCRNGMDAVGLLKSLSEQELVFVRYKEMDITFTEETEKRYKCKDLIRKLPLIFPNLSYISIETQMVLEPECLVFLKSLLKIEKLRLILLFNASWGLFPCSYCTNVHAQMHHLTELSLRFLDNVCIHSVLDSGPSLRYLTLKNVYDSRCTHEQAVTIYPSVSHLALIEEIGEAVVEKCMRLCPSITTLALIEFDQMQLRINSENLTNLTHLSLDYLQMETAAFLVENCKNLQVLNLTNQLPVITGNWLVKPQNHKTSLLISKEVLWFQRHSPFVKVMNHKINEVANWFEDEGSSPFYPSINFFSDSV